MVYSEVNTILTIDATPYYYGYRTLCDHSLGSFLQLPCIGDTTMQGPARDRDPVHTLGSIFDATEKFTGCAIERAYVDKGYRGHDIANRVGRVRRNRAANSDVVRPSSP
jgi:hypothetical protein